MIVVPSDQAEIPTGDRDLTVEPAAYRAAVARLDALIDLSGPPDQSLPAIWGRAAAKLDRARAFLAHLGNPQDRFPIVHVTGTSGKGSTCVAIARVLSRAGYRTGLATSPYLQVATEKLQIDGRLIGAQAFADLVDRVLDAAGTWQRRAGLERPLSYGEIWVALMALWFAERQVDIAVIEVGAGGRFDVTNLVQPVVAVVTSVGLDHTATLGPTIERIAWHKAGIFKAGAPAVTAVTDPVAFGVLAAEATALGIDLTRIDPTKAVVVHESGPDGTGWSLRDRAADGDAPVFHSRVAGRHHAINGAVAVTALDVLRGLGYRITDRDLVDGLAEARLPGRGERMPNADPVVLIDAAHNPDKVRAFVASLRGVLPGSILKPPVLLTGAVVGKDLATMMASLAPVVSAVVTTSVEITGKAPIDAASLAKVVAETGFAGPVLACADVDAALDIAIRWAAARGTAVVATGSLYLAGAVRGRWYPADEIVRQQTPWPEQGPSSGDSVVS
ncbi:MAG: Mur ligase family protein [Chloroflexota bacterium]|nr:Mur ligase family protein [Chloroflexota bacterium]